MNVRLDSAPLPITGGKLSRARLSLCALVLSTPALASEIPATACDEVVSIVQAQYFQPIDPARVRAACPDRLEAALNPHSHFYPDQNTYFPGGTGSKKEEVLGPAAVGVELRARDGGVFVLRPIALMPAALAGVRPGDRIVAVDGKPVGEPADLDEVVAALRGQPDTQVTLTLLRSGGGEPVQLGLKRTVNFPGTEMHWLAPGYVRVRLLGFGSDTARLADSLNKLLREKDAPPLRGLIFDFRDNPGGMLDTALDLARAFLPPGSEIMRMQGRGDETNVTQHTPDKTPEPYDKLASGLRKRVPIAVLVNHATGAAGEIVAGAWQAHRRAQIIGQPTWGKNTIETLIPLAYHRGFLKLSTASWTLPGGGSVADGGLKPDVLSASADTETFESDATAQLAVRRLTERNDEFDRLGQELERAKQGLNIDDMLTAASRMHTLSPLNAGLLRTRSGVYAMAGNMTAAREDLARAIELEPESENNANARCWLNLLQLDFDAAHRDCQEDLSERPFDVTELINDGHAYWLQGNTRAAWKRYIAAMPLMLDQPLEVKNAQRDFVFFSRWKSRPAYISRAQALQAGKRFAAEFARIKRKLAPANRQLDALIATPGLARSDEITQFAPIIAAYREQLGDDALAVRRMERRQAELLLLNDRYEAALPLYLKVLPLFLPQQGEADTLQRITLGISICVLNLPPTPFNREVAKTIMGILDERNWVMTKDAQAKAYGKLQRYLAAPAL